MSSNPSYVKVNRGAIPTWSDFNALADLVQRQRLRQGVGYIIREGVGGTTLNINAGTSSGGSAWPFKVYNRSSRSVGQVQINGGDGFVATINGVDATVNGGGKNDQATGSPAQYPKLPIGGNGSVYAYVTLTSSLGVTNISTVDIQYAGNAPSPDTNNPPGYAVLLIATITNYNVDDSGNVTFMVNNTTNTGFAQMGVCNGSVNFW